MFLKVRASVLMFQNSFICICESIFTVVKHILIAGVILIGCVVGIHCLRLKKWIPTTIITPKLSAVGIWLTMVMLSLVRQLRPGKIWKTFLKLMLEGLGIYYRSNKLVSTLVCDINVLALGQETRCNSNQLYKVG